MYIQTGQHWKVNSEERLGLTYSATVFILSRVTILPIHNIVACCVTLSLGPQLSYQHSQLLIFLKQSRAQQ